MVEIPIIIDGVDKSIMDRYPRITYSFQFISAQIILFQRSKVWFRVIEALRRDKVKVSSLTVDICIFRNR